MIEALLLCTLSAAPPATRFSSEAAFAHLRKLVALPRHYEAGDRERAVAYMVEALKPHVDEVSLQRFDVTERVSGKKYRLTNVVGRQHSARGNRVLLGSHWDSRLWAEQEADPARRGKPIPGANDSGSGIAVLLELARATKAQGDGIDFVFFDGEELGRPESLADYCAGSAYFAQNLSAFYGKGRPSAVLIIDMVGDANQDFYYERTSLRSAPQLVEALFATAARLGHAGFHATPKYDIIDDHTPFQRLGIPAALLIDFDYPAWHTHADDIAHVSPQSLGATGSTLLSLLSERSAQDGGW